MKHNDGTCRQQFLSALDDRTEAEQKFGDQRCNLLCLHVYKTIDEPNVLLIIDN